MTTHYGPDSTTRWVYFSDLQAEAGISDEKKARKTCDDAGLERVAIGVDMRRKSVQVSDVPAFFRAFARPTPEQSAAFTRILSELNLPDAGQPEQTPDSLPDKLPGKPPAKSSKPSGETAGKSPAKKAAKWPVFLENAGQVVGDFYASPLFAYSVLTGFLAVQAFLHGNAATALLPSIPAWELYALTVLMQLVVLIGTMHSSRFFGSAWGYFVFMFMFAVYDTAMNACNFFVGFSDKAPTPVLWWIGFVMRLALSIGFPVATVFYAFIVKKIRQ